MAKTLLLVLTVFLAMFCFSPNAGAQDFIRGDANGDEVVSILDPCLRQGGAGPDTKAKLSIKTALNALGLGCTTGLENKINGVASKVAGTNFAAALGKLTGFDNQLANTGCAIPPALVTQLQADSARIRDLINAMIAQGCP